MKKRDLLLLIAFIFGLSSILIKEHKVGDYYTDYYYDCVVTHKMETGAGYKVHPKFILVLKLDDNRRIDIDAYVCRCMDCSEMFRLKTGHDILADRKTENFVFEGAQGILLDREHGIFPHVTRSHTTSANVYKMLSKFIIKGDDVKVHYLCRAYQTRHGNGPLLGEGYEVKLVNNENETNVTNEWQGVFRKAPLSLGLLKYAIDSDIAYHNITCIKKELTISHLDQLEDIPLLNKNGSIHLTTRVGLVDFATELLSIPVLTHNSEKL